MDQESICKKIRELRIEKGFSQKYIGDKCGLTQQAINRIEHGFRKIDIDLLRKIAAALGVYISDLVDDWNSYSKDEIEADWEISSITAHKDAIKAGSYHLNDLEKPLLDKYRKLNLTGQNKAIEQVELLTKIPEYQKEE